MLALILNGVLSFEGHVASGPEYQCFMKRLLMSYAQRAIHLGMLGCQGFQW
jgi:hypothetical protein